MNKDWVEAMIPIADKIRRYHKHRVIGIKNIPKKGAAIIACNHSLATYDMMLLMSAIVTKTKRYPRSLIDRAFYRVPYLSTVMENFGGIQGTHDNAHEILENGDLLYLAPGGMKESLKPHQKKYTIQWEKRKGFAKLAIDTQTPIILAACPKADDIYKVYDSKLSKLVYENFKMPFFFASGLKGTPLPKPIQLSHYLSELIEPPKKPRTKDKYNETVDKFHEVLEGKMKELMQKGS